MYRAELNYSNEDIIDLIEKNYHIKIQQLKFIKTGSFFAFKIITQANKNFFLKVYPKYQILVPQLQPTANLLTNIGFALQQFRQIFGIQYLSYCLPKNSGQFYIETDELLFVLFEYVEGSHPAYSPNQLHAAKLAQILFKLHQLPIEKFTYTHRKIHILFSREF